MREVRITIKNLQRKIRINSKYVKKAVLETLSLKHSVWPAEINICFVNAEKIKEFNARFLQKDSPTDVIAFGPSFNKDGAYVDIAVSSDAAIKNAKIFKTTPLYELYLYIIHGVLHILGYDDKTPGQRKKMEAISEGILNKLSYVSRKPKA